MTQTRTLLLACVVLVLAAIGCGAAGFAVGSLPLSAVEPDSVFVNRGPAVFGRLHPLPHSYCAGAFFPLPQVTVTLFALGLLCVIATILVVLRRKA